MERNNQMTMIEHLTELRKRLIWVLLVFFVGMILGFMAAGPCVDYLKANTVRDVSGLYSLSPPDVLQVYVQVAFMISFVLTLPFLLFQVWRFVSPGLRKAERRVTVWFIPAAVLLFVGGVAFAYFWIFPFLLRFMSMIAERMNVEQLYGIRQYFQVMFNVLFPIGLLFELPIVVIFLTRLGVLNPKRLAKMRKVAYLVLVIVAALITPPEIISNILVSIPLIILYEISLILSRVVYRRKRKREAEWGIVEPDDE